MGTGQHGEDLKAATELWAPAVLGVLFEALHPVQADDATPFMHDVWSQIRVSAHLAEVVASEEQMPRHEMNLTAIAAILSQAGALVLESICHEEYLGLRLEAGRHAVPIEVMERAYFGLSAHEVVAWLGRLWGLPSIVADLLDQCATAQELLTALSASP